MDGGAIEHEVSVEAVPVVSGEAVNEAVSVPFPPTDDLHSACCDGNAARVQELLDSGAVVTDTNRVRG